jgi:tRNA(Arg) A34 adenosine deaminase TadA
MKISKTLQKQLIDLMTASAKKGNLANAGAVLENGKVIATAESWVVSSCDATAHSERMLVEIVGKLKHSNYTPNLTMISVIEPCTMCLSACSQAGFKEIAYIIPAKKYFNQIPWMTDGIKIDKQKLAKEFSNPIYLVHLNEYEEQFCKTFTKTMRI